MAQQELPQMYPQPGWVEHDPDGHLAAPNWPLRARHWPKPGISARDIHAIGITNQRETTVVWNRKTGVPLHHAIVWQDRRAEPVCAQLRADGKADTIQAKTGLLVDAYFSGTKLQWILNHVPGARTQALAGELAFGTVDSWLLWQLTGGCHDRTRAHAVHATDVSNASRTMLFNIHNNQWDEELLQWLDIPCQRVAPGASVVRRLWQRHVLICWVLPFALVASLVTSKVPCSARVVLMPVWPRTPMARVASC
jgi:glycerol kinase